MSRSVPNAFESRSSHSSGERKRVGGGGHFNQTIFGGPPERFNHSYAVEMHLLNTANRLLMVFRDNPCLMLFALNCSTCIALISSIRIFPKYGMSAQFSVLRFVFCSEYLLLGTEYAAYPVDSGLSRCSMLSNRIGAVARVGTDGEGAVACRIQEVVFR